VSAWTKVVVSGAQEYDATAGTVWDSADGRRFRVRRRLKKRTPEGYAVVFVEWLG
jgi:hypothetical protein